MKEAEIKCEAAHVRVPELTLDLSQGEVAFRSESAARSSDTLMRYQQLGGVSIKYHLRCVKVREAPLTSTAPSRPPVCPARIPEPTSSQLQAHYMDLHQRMKLQCRELEIRVKTLEARDVALGSQLAGLKVRLEEMTQSRPPKPPKSKSRVTPRAK